MSTNWEFVSGPFEGEAFAHRSNGFLTLEFTEEESKMVDLDSELVADNGWTGTVEELLLEMEEQSLLHQLYLFALIDYARQYHNH